MDMDNNAKKALAEMMMRESVKHGKGIAIGWAGFRKMVVPKDASPQQVTDMRNAFYAGAMHLFHTVLSALSPKKDEITQGDLDAMHSVTQELAEFEKYVTATYGHPLKGEGPNTEGN